MTKLDLLKRKFSLVEEKKVEIQTNYHYSYVELDKVVNDPSEYIIPECMDACVALWDKNIETFMVSNEDNEILYVLMMNLSEKNKEILEKRIDHDWRYFYNDFRLCYGIRVNSRDPKELEHLTECLKMQDVMNRCVTGHEFLDKYMRTGGKKITLPSGKVIVDYNPALVGVTLEDALKETGKSDLYVGSEGRVYDNKLFLEWHMKYIEYENQPLKIKCAH